MQEETIQLTITSAVITDIAAARELQDWCKDQVERGSEMVYCRITNHLSGGYAIEVGGATAHEQTVQFGDTVVWDPLLRQFSVTRPTPD